jgi:hypothetical protein
MRSSMGAVADMERLKAQLLGKKIEGLNRKVLHKSLPNQFGYLASWKVSDAI